jgi:hypothetical protein
MARQKEKTKRYKPKTILRFPDLEQSKNAVVNSLPAASSQESYGHAIDEFIGWYCSEPRLAFNRTVVLRYRFFLEVMEDSPPTRVSAIRHNSPSTRQATYTSPILATAAYAGSRLLASSPQWLEAGNSFPLG